MSRPRNSQQCYTCSFQTIVRFSFSVLLILSSIFCFSGILLAQSSTATLSGTVEDQNGAIVAGANIALVSVAHGSQRLTTTNSEGRFVFPQLTPGQYSVTATREGFAPVEVKNVLLNVNDQVALHITLTIGEISQSVEVIDGASLINESSEVATVVDRQFVGNLPLNGRSFHSLMTLSPGVVQTKVGSSDLGQFSVNGQRADANYFTVDGASANTAITGTANPGQTLGGTLPALTVFGGTNNLVSVDALEEFKVMTSSYAAEFGRSPGAQVSIVTRSGSNNFHGAFFDYVRNDIFDANDWFTNRNRGVKPPLRQNDFGGVFHGPILLPRFGEGGKQPWYNGRNRTFFFLSYEGLRLRQPQVISQIEVPSINLRQTAAPQIRPYLNAFAIPNGPDLGNGLAQFSTGYSIPATLDATSLRIDHVLSDKLNLFGRFNHAPSETTSRANSQLSSPRTAAFKTRSFTLGASFSATPTTHNDLRINFTENSARVALKLDDFGGAVPVPDAALFPAFATPEDSQVAFSMGFGGNRAELRVGRTTDSLQRQFNLVDTLSHVAGDHQLKFGIDVRRLSPAFRVSNYFQQSLFSNANAVRNATVSSLGLLANGDAEPRFINFSAFAQDIWRTSQRLTITYGVRWEINPAPHGADENDPYTATGVDDPASITLAPRGTSLYETRYLNLAPRFGISYMLSQRPGLETVLRGGIGIFYDMGNAQSTLGFTLPPFASDFVTKLNVPFPLSESVTQAPPFPSPPFRSVAVFEGLKLPRTYQWNFAVEQSLGAAQTISASYVGAQGRQLINVRRLVNPNPRFTSVLLVRNDATSDYHALQVQFQRRLTRGLQALASYTWSHSLDDASSDISIGLEHGSSDFDLRHAFSAAMTYDIPSPRARFARALFGNWSIDTIVRLQGATPVDLIARTSVNLFGEAVNVRPDLNAGQPLYVDDPNAPGGRIFNRAAFAIPLVGRQGTFGRNVMRGFPLHQTDFSLRRRFNFGEKLNLLFRADVFNIFNHPNFADPINSLSSATFGQSTQTFGKGLGSGTFGSGLSPLYQISGARSMQFSFKVQF